MSDSRSVHDEMVEDYALGMLEGDDLREFERRLETDSGLRAGVAASRDALASMGFAIPVRPDATLRDRVIGIAAPASAPARAAAAPPPVERVVVRRSWYPLGIALAALLVAALVVAKLVADLRDTREVAAAAEVRVAARDLELAQRDSLIARFADPSLLSASLVAASGPGPAVRVYLDRTRRTAMLSAASIDSLPAGREYQLWFFVAGTPSPMRSVTFNATASGIAMVTGIEIPPGVITATAVTVEPAGGSPAPTTPVVFAGSFDPR